MNAMMSVTDPLAVHVKYETDCEFAPFWSGIVPIAVFPKVNEPAVWALAKNAENLQIDPHRKLQRQMHPLIMKPEKRSSKFEVSSYYSIYISVNLNLRYTCELKKLVTTDFKVFYPFYTFRRFSSFLYY